MTERCETKESIQQNVQPQMLQCSLSQQASGAPKRVLMVEGEMVVRPVSSEGPGGKLNHFEMSQIFLCILLPFLIMATLAIVVAGHSLFSICVAEKLFTRRSLF